MKMCPQIVEPPKIKMLPMALKMRMWKVLCPDWLCLSVQWYFAVMGFSFKGEVPIRMLHIWVYQELGLWGGRVNHILVDFHALASIQIFDGPLWALVPQWLPPSPVTLVLMLLQAWLFKESLQAPVKCWRGAVSGSPELFKNAKRFSVKSIVPFFTPFILE